MRILEIGCGKAPGPVLDGATSFRAIDADPAAVAAAAKGPIAVEHGDATLLGGFSDGSVDMVLARNVFGDPHLGLTPAQKKSIYYRQARLLLGDTSVVDELSALQARASTVADQHKRSMLAACHRVLADSGRLLAIEQITPHIAESFFGRLHRHAGALSIHRAALHQIAPLNYVKYQQALGYESLQAWLGVKQ